MGTGGQALGRADGDPGEERLEGDARAARQERGAGERGRRSTIGALEKMSFF